MSTYKLIQDIEAEDHILGPLSLRQFIYALVAAFLYYLSFIFYTKGVAFLLIFLVPPALFFSFFAFPFGKDQSTEVWALAKLRFLFKPRRRVWNQSGMKELVTITVPKRIERILTDGLGQEEVRSRLSALANTLDSRGWAVKNVSADTFNYVDPLAGQASDRLLDISNMPREVPNEVYVSNDVLDDTNSSVAQQFTTMIDQSEKQHRQEIMNKMKDASLAERLKPEQKPADYWFMNQPPASQMAPNATMFSANPVVQPGNSGAPSQAQYVTAEEQAIIEKGRAKNTSQPNPHMKTLQPISNQKSVPVPSQTTNPTPATPPANPAIIQTLAGKNDLSIATLAREAKKELNENDNEVVISLH